jgi:hypothetical protein
MGFAADSDLVSGKSASPSIRMRMGLIGWSPMCAPIRQPRCCAAFGLSSADR